jgi:hypothetical protein
MLFSEKDNCSCLESVSGLFDHEQGRGAHAAGNCEKELCRNRRFYLKKTLFEVILSR